MSKLGLGFKREGEAAAEPYITGRARLGWSLAVPNLSESRVLGHSQASWDTAKR
jgi:hypothetical protein